MKRLILAIALVTMLSTSISSANRSNATVCAIMGEGARTVAVYEMDDEIVGDRFLSELPAGVRVGDRIQVR